MSDNVIIINKQWPAWTWTKRVLLGLIATIQGVALYSNQLPYFPIEVSRTAATTLVNRWLFPVGVLALPAVAYFVDRAPWSQLQHYVMAWLGLVALAWYDDVAHPIAHVVGVIIMVLGLVGKRHQNTTHRVVQYKATKTPTPITELIRRDNQLVVCGAALYCCRGAMKALVVTQLEGASWWLTDIVMRCTAIGQGGEQPSSPITLNVFRLCGALQWGVFYMLSSILP